MQSLLRWSIENSSSSSPPSQSNQSDDLNRPSPRPLDPGIIDMILGKPDAERMKEALAVAVDPEKTEEERVAALDEFEELVEQIDNSNDLEKLKMWEPLHALLTSPTSTDRIKLQTLWTLGTAVQNNPAAQAAYLSHKPLPTLLSFLSPTTSADSKVRSKAVYALSGLLKHDVPALRQFEDARGWEVFKEALEDSDITVRRKVAFLINALLIPTSPDPASTSSASPPQAAPSPSQTTSTILSTAPPAPSTALIPSPSQPSSTATALHTPASPSAPIHPNSHASLVSDPSSADTSPLTTKAMKERGLLGALVRTLVSPVPHGVDGEEEGDGEVDERVVRSLHTYATSCRGTFSPSEKQELARYFEQRKSAEGGADGSRWGLDKWELGELLTALQ